MKNLLAIAAVLLFVPVGLSQDRVFVTSTGYSHVRVSNSGSQALDLRTGFSDVTCSNGVCFVPVGDHSVLSIPASTAFFALSNPESLDLRVREFVQIPGTTQIVTSERFVGNPQSTKSRNVFIRR